MRTSQDLSPDLLVYRRVTADQWEETPAGPVALAFAVVDARQALSLYLADSQTPRSVLQLAVDSALRRRNDRFLEKHGRTVEELVQNGWRVVSLPLGALLAADLTPGPSIGRDGHIELLGDPTRHLRALVRAATVLSAEECLK